MYWNTARRAAPPTVHGRPEEAAMFAYTRRKSQDEDLPLIVGYAELLAWLRTQEELSVSEFERFARQPVREILARYEDLRQQVARLQDATPPPDAQPGTAAVLREVLDTFGPNTGLLKTPSPDTIDAFYDHAWQVCHRCDSCFVEYSHLLVPAYSDLVLALHNARDGIRRETGTLGPAVTEFRLLSARIEKIRRIHAAIQKIDAETRIAMAKETLAAANIHTHQARLAAIVSALAILESDPEAYAARKRQEFEALNREKEKFRDTYNRLAVILSDLTRRARGPAVRDGDSEAVLVLDRLTAVLGCGEVPDGDDLFSALINGYPVLIEMLEKGDLVVQDETEQYLFMDAGTFNNGMRNLCKDYRSICERLGRAAADAPWTNTRARREELLHEKQDLEMLLRSEAAIRSGAQAFQETTALHRQTMARMIEDCIFEMTGRTARLRLNWPPSDAGAPPVQP